MPAVSPYHSAVEALSQVGRPYRHVLMPRGSRALDILPTLDKDRDGQAEELGHSYLHCSHQLQLMTF